MRQTESSKSRARTSANAPAVYHGPRPGASRALARSTGAKITAGMAKAAPVKLAADGRAFHLEEYRRASQLVKGLRTDAAGRTKNADQQEWCDALAVAMAAVFEADSRQYGVPFSPSYFVAGTR
jgi:hypothetical protein